MKKKSPLPKLHVTWLGHSAFRLQSNAGKTVLVDPWLENPNAPPGVMQSVKADIILVTHSHSDHVGNTEEIAKRTGARVIAIYELCLHFQGRGIAGAVGMNKGGTMALDGIEVTMVDAKHSSDIDGGGIVQPGGEAAGYVVKFENGVTVYHAGDTAVFGDMKLIAQLYKPDVVLLPIGGLYTMGPREAALACTLLKPKHIIGMHYGTFPSLTGTPAELKKFLSPALRKRVIVLEPGRVQAIS